MLATLERPATPLALDWGAMSDVTEVDVATETTAERTARFEHRWFHHPLDQGHHADSTQRYAST